MVDRVEQLKTAQDEARELFSRKNADYGDAFATYGTIGVLVRNVDTLPLVFAFLIHDKLIDGLFRLHQLNVP